MFPEKPHPAVREPPQVVREKTARLTGDRVACILILAREMSEEEIRRFHEQSFDGTPSPERFGFDGRVAHWECPAADESKWRLAFEIFLVKSFRESARQTAPDARTRAGLRRLRL